MKIKVFDTPERLMLHSQSGRMAALHPDLGWADRQFATWDTPVSLQVMQSILKDKSVSPQRNRYGATSLELFKVGEDLWRVTKGGEKETHILYYRETTHTFELVEQE